MQQNQSAYITGYWRYSDIQMRYAANIDRDEEWATEVWSPHFFVTLQPQFFFSFLNILNSA